MLKVDAQLKEIEKDEITHTQLVRYAGASGDFHPLHTVVPFAQRAGLDDVIAHGMLIMGFIGQAILIWFPTEKLVKFSTRFQKMTKPGDQIIVKGKIIDETPNCWVCEAIAISSDGEEKAKATFELKKN